jgi:hypothetical protein
MSGGSNGPDNQQPRNLRMRKPYEQFSPYPSASDWWNLTFAPSGLSLQEVLLESVPPEASASGPRPEEVATAARPTVARHLFLVLGKTAPDESTATHQAD